MKVIAGFMGFKGGNEAPSFELQAMQGQLINLAGKSEVESAEAIKALLESREDLDPYYKERRIEKDSSRPSVVQGMSAFQAAFLAGNVRSLVVLYKHKPEKDYKHLLDDLVRRKLKEEIEKSEPSIEDIKFLLDNGADPYAKIPGQLPIFQEIYQKGNLDLLLEIYKHKPPIHNNDEPALELPLIRGLAATKLKEELEKESPNLDQIDKLLKHADLNVSDPNSKAILELAQVKLQAEVDKELPDLERVKAFLKVGADSYKPHNGQKFSAFEKAYKKEFDQIEQSETEEEKELRYKFKETYKTGLMDCIIENNVSKNPESMVRAQAFAQYTIRDLAKLHESSDPEEAKSFKRYDPESVKCLLSLVDPYERGKNATSLFEAAYYARNYDVQATILEAHENKNILNNLKLTTEIEKEKPSSNMIQGFLESGADPCFVDVNGQTAMGKAIEKAAGVYDLELAYILYDRISKEEQKNYDGALKTVSQEMLLSESQKASPDIATINLLLDRGVDPYLAQEGKKSAFEALYHAHNDKLVSFVQDIKPNKAVHATLLLGTELQQSSPNIDQVKVFLDKGADPFYRSEGEYASAYTYAKESKNWQAIIAIGDSLPKGEDKDRINRDINNTLSEKYTDLDLSLELYKRSTNKSEHQAYINELITARFKEYSRDGNPEALEDLFEKVRSCNHDITDKGQKLTVERNTVEALERVLNQDITYDKYERANPNIVVVDNDKLHQTLTSEKIKTLYAQSKIEIASKEVFQLYAKDHRAQFSSEKEKRLLEDQFHQEFPNVITYDAAKELIGEKNIEAFKQAKTHRIITKQEVKNELKQLEIAEFSKFMESKPILGGDIQDKTSSCRLAIDFALNNIQTNPELLAQVVNLVPQNAKAELVEYLEAFDIADAKAILAISDNIEKLQGKSNLSEHGKDSLNLIASLVPDDKSFSEIYEKVRSYDQNITDKREKLLVQKCTERKTFEALERVFNEHITDDKYKKANPNIIVDNDNLDETLTSEKIETLYDQSKIEIASEEVFQAYAELNRAQLFKDSGKLIRDPSNAEYQKRIKVIGAELKKKKQPSSEKDILDYMINNGITFSPEKEKRLLEDQYHRDYPNEITYDAAKKLIGEENIKAFKQAETHRIITEQEKENELKQLKIAEFSKFMESKPILGGDIQDKTSSCRLAIDFALDNIQTNPELLGQVVELVSQNAKAEIAQHLEAFDIADAKAILAISDNIEKLQDKSNLSKNGKDSLKLFSSLMPDDKAFADIYENGASYETLVILHDGMNNLQKEDWQKLPQAFRARYNATIVQATEKFIQEKQDIIKSGDIESVAQATEQLGNIIDKGAKLVACRREWELQEDMTLTKLSDAQLKIGANGQKERRYESVISSLVKDSARFEKFLDGKPYLGKDPFAENSVGGLALGFAIDALTDDPNSKYFENFVERIIKEYGPEEKNYLLNDILPQVFQSVGNDQQNVINRIVVDKLKSHPYISIDNLTELWVSNNREAQAVIAKSTEEEISNTLVAYSKQHQETPINADLYNAMYGKLTKSETRIGPVLNYIEKDNGQAFGKLLKDKNWLLRFVGNESVDKKIKESFTEATFENKKIINRVLIENKLPPLVDEKLLLGYLNQSQSEIIPEYVSKHLTKNRTLLELSSALENGFLQSYVNRIVADRIEGKSAIEETSRLSEHLRREFESLTLEAKIAANNLLELSGEKPIVNAQYLSDLYASPNKGIGKAIAGMMTDEEKALIAAQMTPEMNLVELRKDLNALTVDISAQMRIALTDFRDNNPATLGAFIDENKTEISSLLREDTIQDQFKELSLERRIALNELLISKDIEPLVDINLLKELHEANNGKDVEFIEKLSSESLSALIKQAALEEDPLIDPNIVAKMANKSVGSDDFGFVLKNPKQIEKLTPENLKVMAEYYDPKEHSSIFLMKLIDVHDVKGAKNSDVVKNINSNLSKNIYFGDSDFKRNKQSSFDKSVEQYLETKHQLSKPFNYIRKFLIGGAKKLNKRIDQAASAALGDDIKLAILEDMYSHSTEKAKRVNDLINTMPINAVQSIMKELNDREDGEKNHPELLSMLYNRAIQLHLEPEEKIASIILSNEKAVEKLSPESIKDITIRHYDPSRPEYENKILDRYVDIIKESTLLDKFAKIFEAIGIHHNAPKISAEIRQGIEAVIKKVNEQDTKELDTKKMSKVAGIKSFLDDPKSSQVTTDKYASSPKRIEGHQRRGGGVVK